jgi:hypothetical protein
LQAVALRVVAVAVLVLPHLYQAHKFNMLEAVEAVHQEALATLLLLGV